MRRLTNFLLPAAVLVGLTAAVGAQQQHWSYVPIVRPVVPAVRDAAASRSPIDAFVQSALGPRGLRPSAPADRATWLRRVALDLTGIPPTPDEVAQFVADTSPGADERQVDRLLASPRYGERQAQWWLDLARYADSQGYEKDDLRRSMWRYRDWVIEAFARDLPFDQFTIEQLAGDLLDDATAEQRLATAFHRQTMTNTEGGTDDEEFRSAAVVDRVDTTMSVWMASTLGCAQCHDHKYDPFAQKEFYELYAFFDQTEDKDLPNDAPVLRVPTARQQAASKALELELTALRARCADEATVRAWTEPLRQNLIAFRKAAPMGSVWRVLGPLRAENVHAAHTTPFAPERDGVQLAAEQDGKRWREEAGYVDGKVHQWRGDHSAFYLHRTIRSQGEATAVLSLGSDDTIKVWWNGREVLQKETGRGATPDQELLTVALRPGSNELLLKICNGTGPGGFYFDLRGSEVGADVERILATDPDACDEAAREALRTAHARFAPEFAEVRARIAAAEAELDANAGPDVPVLRELPASRRRPTRLHLRGSFLTPGEVVQPGTPKVWPAMPVGARRDRLGFARWLVAGDNPLTARVLSNRLWAELFGHGLVTTLEDFGSQGERPTHPELLDWLAAEFIEHGWSIKHLLRTIVLSATYAQSSAQTAAHREADPDNRWLARAPAFRLSAETLRDQALAVSGLLTESVGGPSVMPPQPDGVWLQIYSGEKWQSATAADRYRRGLYTFWRRTSPHPAMLVFDAQSREACVLRRQRTNTPLQALVVWNDPQFHEAAQALARRLVPAGALAGDDGERVAWLWRQCLLREPKTSERDRLLELLREERRHFAVEPEAAKALAGTEVDAAELAAWTVLAGVVINLDEFLTRR